MKKLFLILALSFTLVNACFSITWLEKLLLPEFTGDLSSTSIKVVETSDNTTVIEINGVYYIVKSK
jgi:hypothetical protein